MKLLLAHAPLDDPTLPYHSTAYLKGSLVANGFTDVCMRDINIEFINYTFEPSVFSEFNEEADRRLRGFGTRPSWGYAEHEEYQALFSAVRTDASTLERAVRGFRTRDVFLDFASYTENLNCVTHYLELLGALSYPAEHLGFGQRNRGRFSNFSLRDLLDGDLGSRVCYPFEKYFQDRLVHDREFKNSDAIGISIIYDHQLYHALHFARLVKRTWPEKKVLLGGTCISQIYKHLKSKSAVKYFFDLCDAIVVGEGETAICEIVASEGRLDGSQTFMNTILYDRAKDRVILPEVRYENVAALGPPVYDHPWDLYLSPARGINYAPTRGCYWNRCTFCDYGLNTDKPTSPWRERKIDQCIADLKQAQETYGVRYVYFAVDVMAPGYLERLSDAIVDSGLDIRWAAELRMEKIFSLDRCEKMSRAGCVCVSFGMESGNQRILDLIDKGTSVHYMAETMKNFASAGIACQLMAFTDFPTEKPEEKKETLTFITQNSDHWSTGGLGTFLLTGTSMIAKNPAQFGIRVVETQDCDVARAISYRLDSESGQRTARAEDADASFDDSGGIFPSVLGRPWAGGTDTLHSMIYYETYGRNFFKGHQADAKQELDASASVDLDSLQILLNGRLVEASCDLNAMVAQRHKFLAYLKARLDTPAEPTYSSFFDWQASMERIPRSEQIQYWMVAGKNLLKLDKLSYRILMAASKRTLTVSQVIEALPDALRPKFRAYLTELENKSMISFSRDGRVMRKGIQVNESLVINPDTTSNVYGKLAPAAAA